MNVTSVETGLYPGPEDQLRIQNAFVDVVACTLYKAYKAHRAWLARPARGGVLHNGGRTQRFLPNYSREGLANELGPR